MSGAYFPDFKEQWNGGEVGQKQLWVELFSVTLFVLGMFYWGMGAVGIVSSIIAIAILFVGFYGAWKKHILLLYIFMALMAAEVVFGIISIVSSPAGTPATNYVLFVFSILVNLYAIYVAFRLKSLIEQEGGQSVAAGAGGSGNSVV